MNMAIGLNESLREHIHANYPLFLVSTALKRM